MQNTSAESNERTATGVGETGHRMRRLAERLIEEMKRFAVMAVYLWIMFGLFALHERIILRQHHMIFGAQGLALINALVLAKVMLVAEDLNLGRWFRGRPLIYSILHESFVFALVFIGFHVAEHVVIGLVKGEGLAASVPAIGGGGFAGLVCVAIIMFFALIPFFAFRDVGRALEPGRLNAILVGMPTRRAGAP